MWFENLVGFAEENPDQVRENIVVDGPWMTSRVNQRKMRCGVLQIVSLSELRQKVQTPKTSTRKLSVCEIVADVQQLHSDPANANATFQVASQFNLLEMVAPTVTPEAGIEIYERDFTQGPACAISCGAGTIFRNYFVPVGEAFGQTESNQVDCLDELGLELGNHDGRLWKMMNGYVLASPDGLKEINQRLKAADETARDGLRSKLKIGIQWDTQVTLGETSHCVTQVYASALPVAYSPLPESDWAEFSKLILEASYEAAFCAAIQNCSMTDNFNLYLTLLGGGAFGNREEWILNAIRRSLKLYADDDLRVSIVSYGNSKQSVQNLVAEFE